MNKNENTNNQKYTIISFVAVSNENVNKFVEEENNNNIFINAFDDIYYLVLANKSNLDERLLVNDNYRYLKNSSEIEKLNNTIKIDDLLKKYVEENDRFIIIHSYANEYEESLAMKLFKDIINSNKECVNVFLIPPTFTGKVDLFLKYKYELLNSSAKNYYFACDDILPKLPSDLSLGQLNAFFYKCLFEIAYSVGTNFNVSDILDKIISNVKTNMKTNIFEYEDEEFGKIKFELLEDRAIILEPIVKFDNKNSYPEISFDYKGCGQTLTEFKKNFPSYVNVLKNIISKKEDILNSLYAKALELYINWEEVTEANIDYVKEHTSISFIDIYDGQANIKAAGYDKDKSLLGGHFIEAIIDSNEIDSKNIEWNIL